MEPLSLFGWSGILARLGGAMLVGALLGINRDLRGKPAGLRTIALVSLGSALATLGMISITGEGEDAASRHADAVSRVVQGILTGVGFVGAGVILRDLKSNHVLGLTTAATIWISAALGILCGAAQWTEAAAGGALTLFVLILGGPLERLVASLFPRAVEEAHNDDSKPNGYE